MSDIARMPFHTLICYRTEDGQYVSAGGGAVKGPWLYVGRTKGGHVHMTPDEAEVVVDALLKGAEVPTVGDHWNRRFELASLLDDKQKRIVELEEALAVERRNAAQAWSDSFQGAGEAVRLQEDNRHLAGALDEKDRRIVELEQQLADEKAWADTQTRLATQLREDVDRAASAHFFAHRQAQQDHDRVPEREEPWT